MQTVETTLNRWDRVLDSLASCQNKNLQDFTNSEEIERLCKRKRERERICGDYDDDIFDILYI